MDTPAPPLLPTTEPPSSRRTFSRILKWAAAIAGCLALIGFGLLVIWVVVRRSAPPTDSSDPLGWVRLGKEVETHGMVAANQHHDGVTEPAFMGGLDCHALQRYPGRPELYAYFKIDPA